MPRWDVARNAAGPKSFHRVDTSQSHRYPRHGHILLVHDKRSYARNHCVSIVNCIFIGIDQTPTSIVALMIGLIITCTFSHSDDHRSTPLAHPKDGWLFFSRVPPRTFEAVPLTPFFSRFRVVLVSGSDVHFVTFHFPDNCTCELLSTMQRSCIVI